MNTPATDRAAVAPRYAACREHDGRHLFARAHGCSVRIETSATLEWVSVTVRKRNRWVHRYYRRLPLALHRGLTLAREFESLPDVKNATAMRVARDRKIDRELACAVAKTTSNKTKGRS